MAILGQEVTKLFYFLLLFFIILGRRFFKIGWLGARRGNFKNTFNNLNLLERLYIAGNK